MSATQENEREPIDLWQLDSPGARALAADAERLDDLHTTLRCCEALLPDLTPAVRTGRRALVEAAWVLALTSYARCFSPDGEGAALTEEDVVEAVPEQQGVLRWHQALLRLQGLYTSASTNPRERFITSVVRDGDGQVAAIALTSATLPDVDEASVHAAGGIALALSRRVEARIERAQQELMVEAAALTPAALDALEHWQTQAPPPT